MYPSYDGIRFRINCRLEFWVFVLWDIYKWIFGHGHSFNVHKSVNEQQPYYCRTGNISESK